MYNKLISLVDACGNDVYFYQESNKFYITFQDFLGFTDDWEEENFYTTYFFKDFSVQVDYASYDI